LPNPPDCSQDSDKALVLAETQIMPVADGDSRHRSLFKPPLHTLTSTSSHQPRATITDPGRGWRGCTSLPLFLLTKKLADMENVEVSAGSIGQGVLRAHGNTSRNLYHEGIIEENLGRFCAIILSRERVGFLLVHPFSAALRPAEEQVATHAGRERRAELQ
jgi:hypothetical protein